MANTQVQFGFQPYGTTAGVTPNFGLRRRLVAYNYSTALFRGDPVTSLNDGTIGIAASQSVPLTGIFWGCEYYSAASKIPVFSPYWPGVSLGNSGYVVQALVIDDPDTLFLVAELGSTAAITQADVNANVQWAAGAGGNTANGISSFVIDDGHITTTDTLPFKILDLYSTVGPPGANGTAAALYNWAIVKMNFTDRSVGVVGI